MTSSDKAQRLLNIINASGFEAYFVGGCVRDAFMHREFCDIDIASSATPKELEKILLKNDIKYIETGLKHGTVTAIIDGGAYEITTYRTDGEYSDNRHPESVRFVTDIKSDLSRRDFTINAIAFDPRTGETVDPFGGKADIKNKTIRAVGNPDRRFNEDALRIMRAIRFSSVLGFEIEKDTKAALFKNKELLHNVSAERIFAELTKLLSGESVFKVLCEYKEILAEIIPELKPTFDCRQNTVWHIYNVYEHTAKSVETVKNEPALRLTMLLHDIGKPLSKLTDENGVDHFKGHQKVSARLASPILKRLKASNELYDRIMLIIPIHDIHIGTKKKNIKKLLSELGEQGLRDLIEVKRADKLAQNPSVVGKELERLDATEAVLDKILENKEPYKLKDLDINGNDLASLGFEGKEIGECLAFLLDEVISENVKNSKSDLIKLSKTKL